jgi:hypothetical protein
MSILGVDIYCQECGSKMGPQVLDDGIHWKCPGCNLEIKAELVHDGFVPDVHLWLGDDPEDHDEKKGRSLKSYAGYNPASWDRG